MRLRKSVSPRPRSKVLFSRARSSIWRPCEAKSFWSTSICAYEIGNVQTYLEHNRDKGFTVIVVGVDKLEDRARVERMLGIYNLNGVMTDELDESGFNKRYATPTAFVIDRNGILRARLRGAKMPSWFRENVDPLLADGN